MYKKNCLLGFTLVELLVVITIIGLLSASGFVAYGNLSQRNRNDRRRLDGQSIRSALGLYFSNQSGGYYPLTLDELTTGNYIDGLPVDPSTHDSATYENGYQPLPFGCDNTLAQGFCTSYQLTISLEAGEPAYIIESGRI